ncbi:hypothetical protein ACOMHN_009936 [Nucella lapillus]
MPTLDDILMRLNQAAVFSKLDLNQGYHQLELYEQSRNITTFSTHMGLRRYKRLNFGVTSAAEIFQNHIAETLADIDNCLNTSDDIMVYGRTQQQHDDTLKKIFDRLKEKSLTLNREKCEFNKNSIEFYGFIFGKNGISPDPRKVNVVHKMPTPTNAKEVRSFLGMTNYVSRFIKDYADLTKPLRDLTRKNAPWSWAEAHQKAFTELNEKITSDKVMKYFNPDLKIEVIVDASPFGLGCVLSQRDNNDNIHVVAYASRALTDVESRYSQTEREALAVVWACEHFNLYLLGQHFTIVSDHKPLEGIYNKATSRTSARIERWNLRLQPYNFTLRYRPGDNNPADFLSRHPVGKADAMTSHMAKIADEYVNLMANHSVPKAMTLDEIANATKYDPTLKAVIKSVQTGFWHTPTDTYIDVSSYQILKTFREELSVQNNGQVLLFGTQLVIPRSLQQCVINIAHEGHQEVSIDFCGPFPSGDYLLVVVDAYSRFPEIEILSSTSARATIPKLDSIFARHGVPDIVKSDNGPPFSSHEFKQFANQLGFKHRKVTPLWPQANGGVEKCMQMIKKTIQSAHIEGKPWKQERFHFLRNYRATPHSSTGVSPAEALFR